MKKKNIIIGLISTLILTTLFTFNWPVEDISSDNIQSYFGQFRGSTISTSFIFEEPGEIKTIGQGQMIIYMTEDGNDTQMFPSTLGNTIIISHGDDIASVYGNLDKESLPKNLENKTSFAENEVIGTTGNSGYQVKRSNLEFQIYDTKKGSAINPKVFMPRTNNEIPLLISGIYVQNKNGDLVSLSDTKILESGTYKVFQKRNTVATPYKTRIMINGVEVDSITFEAIHENNSHVFINGKKQYTSTIVYPNSELQLLGEAILTPGRIALGIEVENYLGERKTVVYQLAVNN